MSRVLGVKKGFRFHQWYNRINRVSYDFVICDKASTVIAAIELDDKSHESERCGNCDAKKSKATTDAGLRLVRWHVKSLPDELTIQRELSGNDASLGLALPGIYVQRREYSASSHHSGDGVPRLPPICYQAEVIGRDPPRPRLTG